MPQEFWIDEYRRKASASDPLAQTGRGDAFRPVAFMHVVRQALSLLALERSHTLLDVGCANGLLTIALSAQCRQVYAVEPVRELREQAAVNLRGIDNVELLDGHAASIPLDDASVNRVLLMNVAQLMSSDEMRDAIGEMRRMLRDGGRLVLGSLLDSTRRDAHLGPYLAGVRAATHLSDEQKAAIVARNESAHWHDAGRLEEWCAALGGVCERRALPESDPDHDHRLHMIVTFVGSARRPRRGKAR